MADLRSRPTAVGRRLLPSLAIPCFCRSPLRSSRSTRRAGHDHDAARVPDDRVLALDGRKTRGPGRPPLRERSSDTRASPWTSKRGLKPSGGTGRAPPDGLTFVLPCHAPPRTLRTSRSADRHNQCIPVREREARLRVRTRDGGERSARVCRDGSPAAEVPTSLGPQAVADHLSAQRSSEARRKSSAGVPTKARARISITRNRRGDL